MPSSLVESQAGDVVPLDEYGLLAEFGSAEALLRAAQQAYAAGYRDMDAYSPFSIEGLSDAVGMDHNAVPWITLAGAVLGAIGGFAMQWYIHVVSLPINVGGRPLDSWQSFIPVTFEMGVLFAALFTLAGILILNRLPELYHPVFNVERFRQVTRDRFFLCIEARDARFDADRTRAFLASLGALEITRVPA
ncbi:MAG: DUF3341 domain-containing protein [Chloroflexota bacterium]|nr:DUF3341 domain-containing protein [Chloroflexota bacterium]